MKCVDDNLKTAASGLTTDRRASECAIQDTADVVTDGLVVAVCVEDPANCRERILCAVSIVSKVFEMGIVYSSLTAHQTAPSRPQTPLYRVCTHTQRFPSDQTLPLMQA